MDGRYNNDYPLPLDKVAGAVSMINSDHDAIHQGWGYSASVFAEGIADDASVYIEFRTPTEGNGTVHLKQYRAWGEGGVNKLEILEAPTLTTGVTALAQKNRQRLGTPNESASILKSNPTSISGGTSIEGPIPFGGGGAGSGAGGNNSMDQEIVFKPDTTYLIKATNLSGSAKALGIWIFWYEEF